MSAKNNISPIQDRTEAEWTECAQSALSNTKAKPLTLGEKLKRWWSIQRRQPLPLGKHQIPPRLTQSTTAEKWAKKWGKNTYRAVAPTFKGQLPQQSPLFPHACLQGGDWDQDHYEIPALFTVELPHGRVAGPRGATITPDGFLLDDLSRHFEAPYTRHPILRSGLMPPVRSLQGQYALISGPGNSTYHWLFDILPRFAVLKAAGYRLEEFDGFLMRRPKYPAHYETLALLGIPEEKVIWAARHHHLEATRLVVPSFAHIGNYFHPLCVEFLQQLIPPLPQSARRRIYLSRKDTPGASRQVVNEPEVEAVLQSFNIESITLSGLSFVEQAQLFASAELIVAPHGGGLANLCFCKAPASIVELFAPDYTPACFRGLALGMGLDYTPIVAEEAQRAGESGSNIRVDPQRLRLALEQSIKR